MDDSTKDDLWQKLNDHIGNIVECHKWGIDLIAEYAIIARLLKQIRKLHPQYNELEQAHKQSIYDERSIRIKQSMSEALE